MKRFHPGHEASLLSTSGSSAPLLSRNAEDVFHAIADLPEEARARYFAEREIDITTQDEVRALLDFDLEGSFALRAPVAAVAGRAITGLEPNDIRCGPYRLKSVLGSGGMGTVYLAERVDGEVAQRVAVKLLQPGADYPLLRHRFLAERQILAGLSHPNIGRLLDAGHRENGQPYLVMEYIEGQPIDAYAAELAIRRKVALFCKVCAAVGYLHRNLVVHRDLKPGNILVTVEGEPKILDFGIARTLDPEAESTVTIMRILTPGYASPEQVAGGLITTATDIYSLGAVLYELLTGVSPHEFGSDPMASIASVICEGRITPPSKRMPALKGDLEMILMKALRKEPRERYATVEQFSDDLQTFLESGPIRLRKDEVWYRTRKFLRRHWASAATAGVVIASLSTGLYVANRQRVIAEQRFGQLRQLSKRMIDLDGAIRTLPGSVRARQQLVSASLAYLEGLSRKADGDPVLAQEIADGYWRMARIQGVNAEFNLGDHKSAEESLGKADRLIGTVLASNPEDRNALLRSAVIAHDRMIIATDELRADAVSRTREAADRLDRFVTAKDSGTPVHMEGFLRGGDARQAERVGVGHLYTNLGLASVNLHLFADGARYARRAGEIFRPIPETSDMAAQSLSILSNALRYQGQLEGALSAILEARQMSEHATYADERARFFNLYGLTNREALILGEADAINLNRPAEAIELFGKALEMADEEALKDPRDSAARERAATTARDLGNILSEQNPGRALEVFDLGIRRLREAGNHPGARRDLAGLLAQSSLPLRRAGRADEGKARLDEAFAILKATGDYPSGKIRLGSQTSTAVRALAEYQTDTGNLSGAVKTYEQLLAAIMATGPRPLEDLRDAPKLSRIYEALAVLYNRAGSPTQAEAMNSRRLTIWRHWQRTLPDSPFIRAQLELRTIAAR
jgi:serine/threonine protein kinase